MNTKIKNYKKYLKYVKDFEENRKAQLNLGYKKLDVPIHYGYNVYFVLRDDILKRKDSNIIQYIIDNFSSTEWSLRKDLMTYSYELKADVKIHPKIYDLNQNTYNKLPLKVKDYFYEYEKTYLNTIRKYYRCILPKWFFKIKRVKNYKTHYKIISSELKKEEAYINKKLYTDFYNLWSYKSHAPKKYTKLCNRRDRRKSKNEIRKSINRMSFDDMQLPGRHRHYAKWYY